MGGSSGGGGSSSSSSGIKDYPAYLLNNHQIWINNLTGLSNTSKNQMLYVNTTPFNPDPTLSIMWKGVCDFESTVENLNAITNFSGLISVANQQISNIVKDIPENFSGHGDLSTAYNLIDSWQQQYDDKYYTETVTNFNATMRDINAVNSGAFILGRAYLEANKTKELNNFAATVLHEAYKQAEELRSKEQMHVYLQKSQVEATRVQAIMSAADKLLSYNLTTVDLRRALTHYEIEFGRMQMAAKFEQLQYRNELLAANKRWPFEVYEYCGRTLAAIAGGVSGTSVSGPSTSSSKLGGALSGAAAGAAIGSAFPGYGTAIGAVVGAAAGLLMS